MKKKISPVDTPALLALQELGERLRIHRIMRSDTIARMAERLQCSPATYAALEKGAPSAQLGLLTKALAVHGELQSLATVAPIPVRVLMESQVLPKRVRKMNPLLPSKEDLDF